MCRRLILLRTARLLRRFLNSRRAELRVLAHGEISSKIYSIILSRISL